MKISQALILSALCVSFVVAPAGAQVVRRADRDAAKTRDKDSGLTVRAQSLYEPNSPAEKDVPWLRVIYRQLDLTQNANLPLYYPEEPTEDLQNLFRIIMRLLANNQITAYEYLDGREVFTDQYKVNVRDMFDRFHILYTEQKGSTEKNPLFTVEESDVPCNEVLSYYIIEKWVFDRRASKFKVEIDAICPVLHRSGDFGGEPVRYPMFWLRYDDLRPYMAQQYIMTGDANQVMQYNYDDYFKMGMYEGDIYKTRNLRNQSLMQLFPTDSLMKHAQDSIEQGLDTFGRQLWVLTPEEIEAAREAAEAAGDTTAVESSDDKKASVKKDSSDKKKERSSRSSRSSSSKKKSKSVKPKQSSGNSAPVRSVRRTK